MKKPLLFTLFTFSILISCALGAETLVIMVEDAAEPWSNPDGTGIANDVVRSAFKSQGVIVNYDVVPYARCKIQAMEGKVAACFSMTYLPEFEGKILLAKDALIELSVDAYENITNPIPRTANSDCNFPEGKDVGVVIGYEYPAEVQRLIKKNVHLIPVKNDTLNINKLAEKRIDGALIITNKIQDRDFKIKDAGKEGIVRFAFNCGHETGTIGFSLLHPKGKWAYKTYEKGIKEIKKNGRLKKIYQHWFGKLYKSK